MTCTFYCAACHTRHSWAIAQAEPYRPDPWWKLVGWVIADTLAMGLVMALLFGFLFELLVMGR